MEKAKKKEPGKTGSSESALKRGLSNLPNRREGQIISPKEKQRIG